MFLLMWTAQFRTVASAPKARFSERLCAWHRSHMNVFKEKNRATNRKNPPNASTVMSRRFHAIECVLFDASLASMTTTGSMKAFKHAVSST